MDKNHTPIQTMKYALAFAAFLLLTACNSKDPVLMVRNLAEKEYPDAEVFILPKSGTTVYYAMVRTTAGEVWLMEIFAMNNVQDPSAYVSTRTRVFQSTMPAIPKAAEATAE